MATTDPPRTAGGTERTVASVLLSVMGLFTLAVTQPLLDLVGRNAAFVVAHGVRGAGLVAITLALALGVPAVLAGVVLLVRALHRGTGALLHDLLVGVLVAAAVAVALRVGGAGASLPGAAELAIAVAAGIGVAVWFHRSATVRRIVSFTAVAAPAVAVLFLFATPVNGLLSTPAPPEGSVAAGAVAPPVVIVIFDELPLATLLDEQHEVDAEVFPAFAELAEDATFFRNVTASHSSTVEALPALLSGRYVPANTLPIASSHPTNLFSLLRGMYQPHALEPLTQLCTGVRCRGGARGGQASDPTVLLRDLTVVQLHLLVPDDWAGGLPPVDASWRNFGQDSGEPVARGAGTGVLTENTPAHFRRFVRQIRPEIRPNLHVLHALLPHRPWRYLPDGRRHTGSGEPSLGPDGWTEDEWPVVQSHQLHMAQAQFTDKLLGGLLQRLQRRRMYDRALVVVAADHGMSLLPGTPPREVTEETLHEIAPVPLFVKVPGQSSGMVSDVPLETVDITPTVLDALGVPIPPRLDGHSAFDDDAARENKRLIDVVGESWEFEPTQRPLFESVRRKIDLFGAGADYDLYGLAPDGYHGVIGRRVVTAPAQPARPAGPSATIQRRGAFQRVRLDGHVVPALMSGRVAGNIGDPAVIAVAVNGRVAAVTQLADGGTFRALVPPAALRDGRNRVEILSVSPSLTLAKVPIVPAAGG